MDPDKNFLLEKYLNEHISSAEAKKLLNWLNTTEGRKYCEAYFDDDIHFPFNSSEESEDPTKALNRITQNVFPEKHTNLISTYIPSRRKSIVNWLIAATVLLSVSIFSIYYFGNSGLEKAQSEVSDIIHATTADQQKVLTLLDDTIIHLNENSEIKISPDYPQNRIIELDGEAFFEVVPGAESPFTVHSNGKTIEVLGTKFLVKNNIRTGEMIVAVSEGKVLLKGLISQTEEENILESGMVGALHFSTNKLVISSENVTNYFNWLTNRIAFENVLFEEVLKQISRIYDIEHEIQMDELNNRVLTAELVEKSKEEVLSTIASTMGLDVELSGHTAYWRQVAEKKN